jgi:serine/threonine-protein kinase
VKLKSKVVEAYSGSVPAGQVIALNPNVGSSIVEDSTVALTVSKGAKPVVVPSLVGHSVTYAREILAKRGLSLTIGEQIENDSIPANMIASQNPDPESTVAPKSTVSVVVSTGAPSVLVPNVVGQDPQAAQDALQNAGFGVNLTYDVEPANAAQKVAAQNPTAGTKAKKGTKVQIIVSVPGSVPDVTGMSLGDAKSALVASGYKVGNIVYTQQPGTQDGTVVRTEPEANSPLNPGESVNVTVNGTGP